MSEEKSGSVGSKLLGGCGVIVVGFFILGAIGAALGDPPEASDSDADFAQSSQSDSADAAIANAEAAAADAEEAIQDRPVRSRWSYRESRDELRNSTNYRAILRSNNAHDFGFPYGSGNHLNITVRQHPEWGKDVIFRVDNGQLMCGIYDCRYTISFDGAVEGLTLVPPEDRDATVLFARYPEAIIRKLKSSERTVVELQFYQNGNRQFIFDSAGLEWDH